MAPSAWCSGLASKICVLKVWLEFGTYGVRFKVWDAWLNIYFTFGVNVGLRTRNYNSWFSCGPMICGLCYKLFESGMASPRCATRFSIIPFSNALRTAQGQSASSWKAAQPDGWMSDLCWAQGFGPCFPSSASCSEGRRPEKDLVKNLCT